MAAAIGQDEGAYCLMTVLLSHDPTIRTTEAVMVAAAHDSWQGTQMIEVLLSRMNISEKVMTVATKNYGCGRQLIMVLLWGGLNIEIMEDWGVRIEMVMARTFGRELVTTVIPNIRNIPEAMMGL